MRKFIQQFLSFAKSKKYSKPVYFILTVGYINAFGPFKAGRLFSGTGLRLVSHTNITLSNNISTPKIKADLIGPEELEQRKKRAALELEEAADAIIAGKKRIKGFGPYLIPGIMIRKVAKKGIKENYKDLSVRRETCSRCMQCVDRCPTGSIRYSDGSFTFLPSCTACMRCYNNCPTYSILFEGKYADPEIYTRYHGPNAFDM